MNMPSHVKRGSKPINKGIFNINVKILWRSLLILIKTQYEQNLFFKKFSTDTWYIYLLQGKYVTQ